MIAMLTRLDQGETQNPTAMGVAAGLEHFILAVGIDTYDYPQNRGRATSASPFDALLSNRLLALDAGEGASC